METNANSPVQRRLIIRVSRNSLSFATIGDDGQITYDPYPVHGGMSMAANLRNAFRSRKASDGDCQRVLVMVDSPSLMVPTELYRQEEQGTLYTHTFSGHGQDEVISTVLPDLGCVVVFGINKDLKTVVDDHCQHVSFVSAVAPVWRHLHQRSYMGVRAKLYGYFHDQRLEVFSYGQNRFRFCNSFDARDVHNALYYLLFVWKQLGLQPEHDELHLVGEIPEQQWLTDELDKYLKRVYVINPAGDFNRSTVTQIAGMPYDLMTLFVKGR